MYPESLIVCKTFKPIYIHIVLYIASYSILNNANMVTVHFYVFVSLHN